MLRQLMPCSPQPPPVHKMLAMLLPGAQSTFQQAKVWKSKQVISPHILRCRRTHKRTQPGPNWCDQEQTHMREGSKKDTHAGGVTTAGQPGSLRERACQHCPTQILVTHEPGSQWGAATDGNRHPTLGCTTTSSCDLRCAPMNSESLCIVAVPTHAGNISHVTGSK